MDQFLQGFALQFLYEVFSRTEQEGNYTAQIFLDDIKRGEGTTGLGGHAITIIGWGEEKVALIPGDGGVSAILTKALRRT